MLLGSDPNFWVIPSRIFFNCSYGPIQTQYYSSPLGSRTSLIPEVCVLWLVSTPYFLSISMILRPNLFPTPYSCPSQTFLSFSSEMFITPAKNSLVCTDTLPWFNLLMFHIEAGSEFDSTTDCEVKTSHQLLRYPHRS